MDIGMIVYSQTGNTYSVATRLHPWMGGNRAVRQMKRACESKGATVSGSGIVNWMKKSREQQIVQVVDRLSSLF